MTPTDMSLTRVSRISQTLIPQPRGELERYAVVGLEGCALSESILDLRQARVYCNSTEQDAEVQLSAEIHVGIMVQ